MFYNQEIDIDYLIRCRTEKQSGSLVYSIENKKYGTVQKTYKYVLYKRGISLSWDGAVSKSAVCNKG